jgi:hypothetical protein
MESMVRSLFLKTFDGGLYDHRGFIENIIYDLILSKELIQQVQRILTSSRVVIFLRYLCRREKIVNIRGEEKRWRKKFREIKLPQNCAPEYEKERRPSWEEK